MSNSSNWSTCQIVCCAIAAAIGVVALLATRGAITFLAAFLFGIALAVILYVVLTRLFCIGQEAAQPARAPAPGPSPATPEPKAAEPKADDAESPKPAAPAPKPAAAAAEASGVKSGTLLSGEEELAARKGAWRYGKAAAPAVPAKSTEEPSAPASTEGTRPEGLSTAREGGPDDLKQIKGVGPKLEQLLHTMGFYHFDQIANWGADEVAWVDQNLKGFKGRVSRDNWVAQAKILAAGGETEFSKRARDGDVY